MNHSKSENDRFKEMAKQLTGKKKREHIWEYYKLPIIAGIAALIIAASLLNTYVFNPAPDIVFDISIMTPNADVEVIPAYTEELNSLLLDPEKNETVQIEYFGSTVSTDANVVMAIQTKMMAKAALKELDVVIMDDYYYNALKEEGGLADLDVLLSDDIKAAVGDALVDSAIMADNMPKVQTLLGYKPQDQDFGSVYIGIMANSQRIDRAVRAVAYLTQ